MYFSDENIVNSQFYFEKVFEQINKIKEFLCIILLKNRYKLVFIKTSFL